VAHLLHIILLDQLSWIIFWYFGIHWWTFLTAAVFATIAQAQAGWLQHDFGHLSVVPKNSTANHIIHKFVICSLKAASAQWWNTRHFRHHSKPNIVSKDPDIDVPYLFLLGDNIPVQWGKKKRGFMPYQHQHKYWFLFGPPGVLPLFFHYDVARFLYSNREWVDSLWILSFAIRWIVQYVPLLGWAGTFGFYMFVRLVESHWFTWVTQMNHIPMDINRDAHKDWISLQVEATCNVEQSFFNDWFTGHLNFQIEHHLFPTMPRHNYYKVAPQVQKLCQKYNLLYENKSLSGAFADIVSSLKKSGRLYIDAYYHL